MLDRSRKNKGYSKKIKRLRRGIVITVVAACIIPTCICVILSVRYDRLNAKYKQSTADLEWYRQRYGSELSILSAVQPDTEAETDNVPDAEAGGFEQDYSDVDTSGALNPEDIEGTRYVYLTYL